MNVKRYAVAGLAALALMSGAGCKAEETPDSVDKSQCIEKGWEFGSVPTTKYDPIAKKSVSYLQWGCKDGPLMMVVLYEQKIG